MPDTDTLVDAVLVQRIERKMGQLDSRRPLPADALKKLQDEMRLVHTYNSNAIEGNTLTLQETNLVLEEGITIGGKSIVEHLEVTGNAKAFTFLLELAEDPAHIDHLAILILHDIVTMGILEDHGKYRTVNVRITGVTKRPPDFSKILKLLDEMLDALQKFEGHTIEKAAYLHYTFVAIHPFSDGNGRVARLLTNLYLMKHGLPPVTLKKEDRMKYFSCLRKADQGNLKPFTDMIAKAVDESLTLYLSIFGGRDELIPLNLLAARSPYSQEYLSLRARQGKLDAVKIGRVWHSSKAALEDYISMRGNEPKSP